MAISIAAIIKGVNAACQNNVSVTLGHFETIEAILDLCILSNTI